MIPEKVQGILEHIEAIKNTLYWEETIVALYGELGEEAIRVEKREEERKKNFDPRLLLPERFNK